MSSVPSNPPKKSLAPSTSAYQTAPTPASPPQPIRSDKPKTVPHKTDTGLVLRVTFGVLAVAGLAYAVYFFGIVPRMAARTDLDHEQKFSTEHIVFYGLARLAAPKSELPLPGTVSAFQQASIFARTSGYVKRWLVDIGDVVHKDDLLAELDTPDVDQQLQQANATSEQARASREIAKTAADRWNVMIASHAVSQEEADEKNAARDEAKATLDADLANVARLTDLENFKEIRAPFAGTVTFRNIEVGNLVSAGSGSANSGANAQSSSGGTGATTEIYRIAQIDPLRVYIDVPEASARSIQPGVKANIHVPAYPDRVFHGEVVRNAGAIDNSSRTLKTEIRVPNPDGALLPGTYADVHLELVDDRPTMLIPANTLIVNSAGTQVAMLEDMNDPNKDHFKVRLLAAKVGRDFGTEVEILQVIKDGDRLITNPPADLTDGMVVTAKPVPKPPAPAPSSTAPQKS